MIENKFINGVILRLSNSFGIPYNINANCWMLVINNICKSIAIKKLICLNSPGVEYRNFISVGEFCEIGKSHGNFKDM